MARYTSRRPRPKMIRRSWEELTAEQRQHILHRSLPGWHPSNLPKTEDEAKRTRWLVREDNPASLEMGSEIGAITTAGTLRVY